ncbi:hypothetical protein P153DRAFT_401749 [Dothidotthia symphoricarpi CBS 119687]|uniref:Uncharacterized protein n=1 Tax=Dothidotthia symphoricarpi CBS 119687 TaxID=1392245 RepID=A0A6A5ZWM3_9PLEO|nr:uncharacterized protein P153DRAFT_401749 [Dothidotthia symphoricarpi CBS 119687]KAF2123696.1 hypothetical protein P153DRAFT_401749 [Dothidotthia symphoricarpi CBS 119687]
MTNTSTPNKQPAPSESTEATTRHVNYPLPLTNQQFPTDKTIFPFTLLPTELRLKIWSLMTPLNGLPASYRGLLLSSRAMYAEGRTEILRSVARLWSSYETEWRTTLSRDGHFTASAIRRAWRVCVSSRRGSRRMRSWMV